MKLIDSFRRSAAQLRDLRSLTGASLLLALSILLTYFTRADNTVVEEPFSGGCFCHIGNGAGRTMSAGNGVSMHIAKIHIRILF